MSDKNLQTTAGEKKSQQPDVDRAPTAPLTGDTQLNKEKLCWHLPLTVKGTFSEHGEAEVENTSLK